jgi:hypothetical protein
MVRSGRLVNDGAEAMGCPVAITDLDFIAILQIHAAVPARTTNPELDMEPKIAVHRLGHDIGCTVDTAGRRRIIYGLATSQLGGEETPIAFAGRQVPIKDFL